MPSKLVFDSHLKNALSWIGWSIFFALGSSCSSEKKAPPSKVTKAEETVLDKTDTIHEESYVYTALEQRMLDAQLVDVHAFAPQILWELRYADTNNFLKKKLYDSISRPYLQEEAAKMLALAQVFLDEKMPGYHLKIWDGARPVSVQKKMWDALDMPVAQKMKYVSNPKNHSLHNYGCAVDLTIVDEVGVELDMGTDFDYFDTLAWPRYEMYCLQKGILSKEQHSHRMMLRQAMTRAGFTTIGSEWWHFNACSRAYAKKHYVVVE